MSTEESSELFGASTELETGDSNTPPVNAPLFSNTNKDQAMQLLGKGYAKKMVATILSITPANISQYLQDPLFSEAVGELKLETELAHVMRDESMDELEDMALEQLKTYMCLVTKPLDALRIAQGINGMTRRSAPAIGDSASEAKVKELVLPAFLINVEGDINIQVNTNNEVVEVNGRHMTTMPSTKVADNLRIIQEEALLGTQEQQELDHDNRTSEEDTPSEG